jgi:ubiquinone biosynthesis protein COQ9
MSDADNKTVDDHKDDILDAMLCHVPFDGWGDDSIKATAKELGMTVEYILLAFPKGPTDMIKYWFARTDDQMMEKLDAIDPNSLKIRERIVTGIKARFEINVPHKEAVRRTVSFLALPTNVILSTKSMWATADKIWNWAGDTATDYNYYTKRTILSGVYSTTLIAWLNDNSDTMDETWAFLDRRIENVMQFEKLKAQAIKFGDKIPEMVRTLGKARYEGKSKKNC